MSMEYVTLYQIVQFGERDSLYVDVHILPYGDTEKYFSWFADKENQELLALVYDAVLAEATQLKLGSASSSNYLIKRSRNLRVLLKFQPFEYKQHLIIPEHHDIFSGLVPQAMFVSDEGRKVLPFLNQRTQSSGYKAFRISPNSMEVYVDSYPVTDSRGIFKILGKMDPHHTLNTDLMSYFRSPSSMPTLDDVCSLAEIPVTLLKKKRAAKKESISKKMRVVSKEKDKRMLGNIGVVSKAKDYGTTDCPAQGSIRDFIGRTASIGICPPAGVCPPAGDPMECATSDEKSMGYVDLTEDAVEEFCNFGSQDCEDGDKSPANPRGAETPPSSLDETLPSSPINIDETPPLSPRGVDETPPSSLDETPPLSPRSDKTQFLSLARGAHQKRPEFLSLSLKSCANANSMSRDTTSRDVAGATSRDVTGATSRDVTGATSRDVAGATSRDVAGATNASSSLLDAGANVTGNCSAVLELTGLSEIHTPEVSDDSGTSDSGQSHTMVPSLRYSSDSECSDADSVICRKRGKFPDRNNEHKKQRLQGCTGDKPLLRPEESCSAEEHDIVDLTDTPLVTDNSRSSTDESDHSNTLSVQKRKRLKGPTKILEGVECMADLTLQHLRRWMYFHKPLLLDIFKRSVFSRRHEDYVSGNRKKREALKYAADTRMFTSEQAEEVTQFLLGVFCGKHMKYFDYVMSVLLPECITRIVAHVHKITFIQAEEMVLNYYETPRSDSSDTM